MITPLLLGLGAIAMSVPLLIHLLNMVRRYKVVDWAAMDFLLAADKRNRRRVQIEEILMMLLRCLAVLLIGLYLARPYFSNAFTSLVDAPKFQRYVILDDSLSMQAQAAGETTWERGKRKLVELVRSLPARRSEEFVTLVLTSNPAEPVLNSFRLTADSLDEALAVIERLEPSDLTAGLPKALEEMESAQASGEEINRVGYLITDMRQVDWPLAEGGKDRSPTELMTDVAKNFQGLYLVDVGQEDTANLAVTEIRAEGTIISGVSTRFEVTVANHSNQEARDVRLTFTAGESVPITKDIDEIPAGKTVVVPLEFAFTPDDESAVFTPDAETEVIPEGEEEEASASPAAAAVYRRVEVTLEATRPQDRDLLPADSSRTFAARIVEGIRVLLVDGDPSSIYGQDELFYLEVAISPHGLKKSGMIATPVTVEQLPEVRFSDFDVVFLCNLDRMSFQADAAETLLSNLTSWVKQGGSLVLMPGFQVDEKIFNDTFFKDGQGLSPLGLKAIAGNESQEDWKHLEISDSQFPVLKMWVGEGNPFLDSVKIFRWWTTELPKKASGVQVGAVIGGEEKTPAVAQSSFGSGRVICWAIPADADWSNWPEDPSYIVTMQLMVLSLVEGDKASEETRVGQPLETWIDLTQYQVTASITNPEDKRSNIQAFAADRGSAEENRDTQWLLKYDETLRRGFYEFALTSNTGKTTNVLFAANSNPTESDLARANVNELSKRWQETNIQMVSGEQRLDDDHSASMQEISKWLLFTVVVLLCGEQLLGWVFGKKR